MERKCQILTGPAGIMIMADCRGLSLEEGNKLMQDLSTMLQEQDIIPKWCRAALSPMYGEDAKKFFDEHEGFELLGQAGGFNLYRESPLIT